MTVRRAGVVISLGTMLVLATSGCGSWQGLNSVALPGTSGGGDGSYTVYIEMPNITSLQRNSRVRVGDVDVGSITGTQLDGWHALITIRLDGDVALPDNATAKVGQTSLLGTLHVELAPPLDEPARGQLADGDTIPLEHAGAYPTTEQTLASVSTVLNGGGLAQLQDINTELNAALSGHESEIRSLITQIDTFTTDLNAQKEDIISAVEGLDRLAGTVDEQNRVLDDALVSIPPALQVLNTEKDNLSNALTSIGNFADVANRVTTASYDDLVANLRNVGPVLRELANAGPALTDSFGLIPSFPWPTENVSKFIRGDAANLSATIDLTLGRLDNSLLQGTAFDGQLTALETALGRTIGRQPTPDVRNPLTAGLESVVQRGGR